MKRLKTNGKKELREAKGWCKIDLLGLSDVKDLGKFFDIAKELNIEFVAHEPSLEEAIKVLKKYLSEDKSEGSLYYAYQANIAMAFKDEVQYNTVDSNGIPVAICTKEDIHIIANQAAKNFLDLLIKE